MFFLVGTSLLGDKAVVNGLKDMEIMLSWSNLTIDESCDPSHPSNWWNVKVNNSIASALNFVCTYSLEVLKEENFTDYKGELLAYRQALEQTDPENEVLPYLAKISDEDLQTFFDKYAMFWEEYQNVICTNTRQYLTAIDFFTIGLNQPDIIEAMKAFLGDYIVYAERNIPVQLDTLVSEGLWGLDRVDQDGVSYDNTYAPSGDGTGVHVYVIDTGINSGHSDYAGRVEAGRDFIDNDNDPEDCNGHGTHCAGTVLGTTYGVAKGATLHGVRVLSCSGSGTSSGVIAGVNWVAANHISPAVASMSLGGGYSQASNNAISALFAAGVPVAVAAGNSNTDACSASPASSPDAYTVSSSTSSDQRSSFSNYGSCCDMYAPGSYIKSSWIGGNTASNTISGTSMATPHVAGGMAVFLGLNPTATPQEVYTAMTESAAVNKISDASGTPNKLLQVQNFGSPCDLSQPGNSNCVMSEWSSWGQCSTADSCGYGTQESTRSLTTPASGCGSCIGGNSLTRSQECIVNTCPQSEPTSVVTTALDYTSFTLTPSGSSIYEVKCVLDITELPHSTDGHIRLSMGDDQSIQVPLDPSFTFFGQSFDFMYVGSNGFITFGGGDTSYSASATTHFRGKRISVLFVDLNPSRGGVVSYANLVDRAVVTWEAVPYYSNLASVNMQVELFYATGEITFNYAYVKQTSTMKVIGVSKGEGVSQDFTSGEMVSGTTCNPSNTATNSPTQSPSQSPTTTPTQTPTGSPTKSPTQSPTVSPTVSPTEPPTVSPTDSPTGSPTTGTPTVVPGPTVSPTPSPSLSPSTSPTNTPTNPSTLSPTLSPTETSPPSTSPTHTPSGSPTTSPASRPDLPQYLSSPTQVFFPNSKHRRSLLSVPALDPSMYQSGPENESYDGGRWQDKGEESSAESAADNGFSLVGKTATFYPSDRGDQAFSSWDYHITCVQDGALSSTSGWTSLYLGDDNFRSIEVSTPVLFAGKQHYTLYAGSNGYVTFEQGDYSYFASAYNHFSKNRISGMFMDLNPSRGGSVKWTDKTGSTEGFVAIQYKDIPRYYSSGQYSFEIKVYVDGRVQITWDQHSSTQNKVISGISVGSYPASWQNVDIMANENTDIDCQVPPDVTAEIPLESRCPTQEFDPSNSATGSLSADNLFGMDAGSESELSNEDKDALGSASAGNNFFDLASKLITFAPTKKNDFAYEVVCTRTISEFPRNSEGSWTSMSLLDDDSQQVSFSAGESFSFYGNAYDSVYIGSNGYLTFGRSDRTYMSHRYYHYRYPRVSAVFMDLNPSRGGTVQYKQLSDSFIVQFVDVPKYGYNSFTYSFQYELTFEDGTISLSYMEYTQTSSRTIVGVSAGALYSSVYYGDFKLSDLSNNPNTCAAAGDDSPGSRSYRSDSYKDAVEYDSVVENASFNDQNGLHGGVNMCPKTPNLYMGVNYLVTSPPVATSESPAPVTDGATLGNVVPLFTLFSMIALWFGTFLV